MRYEHIIRAVSDTPWAIRADRLAAILDLVAYRAAGHRFTPEEIEARIGAAPVRRQAVAAGSVAVIPLAGVMVPKGGMLTEMSGATSTEQFGAAIAAAAADQSVDAILIDIDSPGGMTDLVPETAAVIRAAREQKPVVAIANTDAASAAYWLGSQASELVVTPSGMVGSIGVFAAHDDVSARMEADGVKTTLISAGKFKVEGSPFEPLSDDARAAIQARVDEFYGMFVRDVAAGRGVSEAAVRGGFGEGRVVTAADALELGMVDRVATFDETLQRLASGAAADHATESFSFAQEADVLRVNANRLVTRAASLKEVERGHLTVAKREHLSACTGALRESVEALEGVLAETEPHPKPAAGVLREVARLEHGRANRTKETQ